MGKKINLWNHQSAFSTLSLNRLLCGHWGCPSHTLYGWLYYITLFHFNQLFFQRFIYFLCFFILYAFLIFLSCFVLIIQKKAFQQSFFKSEKLHSHKICASMIKNGRLSAFLSVKSSFNILCNFAFAWDWKN